MVSLVKKKPFINHFLTENYYILTKNAKNIVK